MSDSDAAYGRLRLFLLDELRRDDVPSELRQSYARWLERVAVPVFADTPLDDLALTARVRTALRRAGIRTAGDLRALSEADRAALPYIGPQFLADIRVALGEDL